MADPFDLASVTLDTPRGVRHALVTTPTRHLRLRGPDFTSSARDAEARLALAREAHDRRGDATLMIFRGKDDAGLGSWALDEQLDTGQAAALGEQVVRWHLPTWRTLASDGLVLLIHLDLDEHTRAALEAGKRVVTRELRLKSRTEGTLVDDLENARARLDLWLLQHLVFFFGLSYGRAMKTTLPDMMPMLDQRQFYLERLLAKIKPKEDEPVE